MAEILLLDDDQSFVAATKELLELLGHQVTPTYSVSEAATAVQRHCFDHLILDLMLPDGSGLHVLEALPDSQTGIQVTLVTGHPSVKSIVTELYGPNIHYLIKPIDLPQLQSVLDASTPKHNRAPSLSQANGISVHYGSLVGESSLMRQLYEMIERVSTTTANVLLTGESGVGKEMVAAAIHQASNPQGPFVAANCGAFPAELISSELFGHEKGAFTGANNRKPGLFEQANSGTLFLDEITEMPIAQQPHLLRALETQQTTPLGSTRTLDFQCRIISATNRSETAIAEQRCLREDLYFRLAVFPIDIPPLRARREDIPLLVDYFLAQLNQQYGNRLSITKTDMQRLCEHDWPGNVRELKHVIHRAYIMADPQHPQLSLPTQLSSPFSRGCSAKNKGVTVGKTVEDVERELIEKTLEHLSGDKKQAADMLGISLKTLYNRLNSYAKNDTSSAI